MKWVLGLTALASGVAGLRWLRRERPPKTISQQVADARRDRQFGWWVTLVLDSFGYLERDYGYEINHITIHFLGSGISYRRPEFDFVTDYDPEGTGTIDAYFLIDVGDKVMGRHRLTVNRILAARNPSLALPSDRPDQLDRETVRRAIRTWSTGLRDLAPDVLAGSLPGDIN